MLALLGYGGVGRPARREAGWRGPIGPISPFAICLCLCSLHSRDRLNCSRRAARSLARSLWKFLWSTARAPEHRALTPEQCAFS